MNRDSIQTSSPVGQGADTVNEHLSNHDLWKLTLYKWRYSLQSNGFSSEQAARLLFLRWLYGQRGLSG